jgi:amidohydrolase
MTAESFGAEIDGIVAEIAPDLIRIRRHLHMHPELSLEEKETAKLVADELDALGLSYRSGIGGHGVATLIGLGNGRVVGVRGDMDALPIEEKSGSPFASTVPGVSHACGHDAHTAIVIGVARVMARLADRLPGRALVVFQPAEEGLRGAKAMIADGILEWGKPDVMLGYHNWPPLDAGKVGFHHGTAFASADRFKADITGRSGHAAYPHLSRDPIVAAAEFIGAAQAIVAREVPPLSPAVVTFGRIQGGTAANQIPDMVTIEGTIRAHTGDVRTLCRNALERVARGVAEVRDVSISLVFDEGVSPVINDPDVLAPTVSAAQDALGSDNVIDLGPGTMGGEDFAEFTQLVPSAHLRIGSRLPDHPTMLHRSDFDLNEECIQVAVRTMCRAAIKLMEQ